VPSDVQAPPDANPRAIAFFQTLDRATRSAVLYCDEIAKRERGCVNLLAQPSKPTATYGAERRIVARDAQKN